MIITKITRQKRNKSRFSVFLDGGYAFSVSEENLIKFRLKEKTDIDEQIIDEIKAAEDKKIAVETVWRLFKLRSRSEKELFDKLKQKKISPEGIDYALKRVKELGYINDEKFAKDRVNYLISKGKGKALIRMELKKHGIGPEIIKDLLASDELSEQSEIEQIKNIAAAKLKRMGKLDPKKASNRLIGFLARRGFDIDVIREGLKKAKLEIEDQ